MAPKNGQKDRVNASDRIARPPTRWLTARKRSDAKFRSANWLLKNIPTIAAIGNAFRTQLCCAGVKPRLGRDAKISGNHAPQMKNSSTIIRKSFRRMALFIGD